MKRYIRASFNTDTIPDWLRKDKYALKALNDKGIDLANCVFSKERKGKVGDNYTVYLVKGSDDFDCSRPFIWIPGVYGEDNSVPFKNWDKLGWGDDGKRHYGEKDYKAVKYMAKKNLKFIDTVYIYKATNGKPYKKDRYIDPRYDEYGNYLGQQMIPGKWHWEGNERIEEPGHWSEKGAYYGKWDRYPSENEFRDKSGYKIPNPKDRLRKFYESPEGMNKRIKMVRNKLDSIYSQLEDAKDNVFNFIVPRAERDDYRKYRELYEYLDKAISYYDNTLEKLEKLERHSSQETLSRWDASDVQYALNDLNHVQEYIGYINNILGLNG